MKKNEKPAATPENGTPILGMNGEQVLTAEMPQEAKKPSFEELRAYFDEKAKINRLLTTFEKKRSEIADLLKQVTTEDDHQDEQNFSFTVNSGYREEIFKSSNRLVLREVLQGLERALFLRVETLKAKLIE